MKLFHHYIQEAEELKRKVEAANLHSAHLACLLDSANGIIEDALCVIDTALTTYEALQAEEGLDHSEMELRIAEQERRLKDRIDELFPYFRMSRAKGMITHVIIGDEEVPTE